MMKSRIIYINARMKEDTELGRLMHDFHCTKAEDMYSEVLAKQGKSIERDTGRSGNHVIKRWIRIYQVGEECGKEKENMKQQ